MSIGVCITARLGSSRLPEKHLKTAGGRPLEEWLIRRINATFSSELAEGSVEIVLTTTDEPQNEAFRQFEFLGVRVFMGSRSNIPLRHLQAARAFSFDAVLAVDGDDILCATEAMRGVYDGLWQGALGVKTEGLPLGMNAWGYKTEFLAHSLKGREQDTLETGWGRIFDSSSLQKVFFHDADPGGALRYTLDYPEDYEFFRALIEHMGDSVVAASAQTIIARTLANGFQNLNAIRVAEYWDNFRAKQAQEARAVARQEKT